MERELEKTLMEIEHLIKVHEQRENTHTQSVLEQAREIIELCAQAARTPSDLRRYLSGIRHKRRSLPHWAREEWCARHVERRLCRGTGSVESAGRDFGRMNDVKTSANVQGTAFRRIYKNVVQT